MKHTLATILLLTASLVAAEVKDEFPEFMNLDKKTAAATAHQRADADFAEGKYRMLVYGLRGGNPGTDGRLAEAGVEVKAIAGCIVNEAIREGARVYNEVMRGKLKAKLGRDIFDEPKNTKSKK